MASELNLTFEDSILAFKKYFLMIFIFLDHLLNMGKSLATHSFYHFPFSFIWNIILIKMLISVVVNNYDKLVFFLSLKADFLSFLQSNFIYMGPNHGKHDLTLNI